MPKKSKKKSSSLRQLDSGNWNTCVYYKDENGNERYKSITAPDPNQVLLAAAQFKADTAKKKKAATSTDLLTVGEAMDRVIASKSEVWSPTTYLSNTAIRKNNLQDLMHVRICDLTQDMVQVSINKEALTHAPKTVRNMHGFLSSVLKTFRPDFTLTTTLPQRVKPKIVIPTEEEVFTLLKVSQGTPMELPIILGAFCGLRRSEIAGLTVDSVDFKNRTLTIREAVVRSKGKATTWTRKTTKTVESTRTIRLFPQAYNSISQLIGDLPPHAPLVTLSPNKITERFTRLCDLNLTRRFKFHSLRHFFVSVAIGQGIPKEYVCRLVGHNSSKMVDEVYFHLMAAMKTEAEDKLEARFALYLQDSCTDSCT